MWLCGFTCLFLCIIPIIISNSFVLDRIGGKCGAKWNAIQLAEGYQDERGGGCQGFAADRCQSADAQVQSPQWRRAAPVLLLQSARPLEGRGVYGGMSYDY